MSKRILIVEDEESIADLEKDYLELSGFEVEVANDGEIGLKKGLEGEFDLIILDLMLPGVDGFEICRQIRSQKNTPIIMVSAKKDDIDKIRGLGLGADDYMTKPFSPSELVARVKAHLARYERLIGSNVEQDIRIMCTARKSFSVRSGIWSRSETLQLLQYILRRSVRRLSMILHIHSILRQSGVWDTDLKYKKKERTLPVNGGVLFCILGKCFPNI